MTSYKMTKLKSCESIYSTSQIYIDYTKGGAAVMFQALFIC